MSQILEIMYTNYLGETSLRRITPHRVWFGMSLPWHPQHQWMLTAFDHDKNAIRDFAFRGFGLQPGAERDSPDEQVEEEPGMSDTSTKAAERLDEEFDTQIEVERNPCGAWMAIQTLSARVAELEAERDDAYVSGMAAGQAAMPRGALTIIDSPEIAALRERAEWAEAHAKGGWALAAHWQDHDAAEYTRADLAPTDAQVMAHPKVRALVEALREISDMRPHHAGQTRNECLMQQIAGDALAQREKMEDDNG